MADGKSDAKKSPNEVDREIGRRIKARRNELGMNQQNLAGRIGVSYQQVQKYENGTDRVGASRLYDISVALGCNIAEFFEQNPAHLREPGSRFEASLEAARVLATDDGRLLVHSYLAIEDTAIRRTFVELASNIAAAMRRSGVGRRVRRPSRI